MDQPNGYQDLIGWTLIPDGEIANLTIDSQLTLGYATANNWLCTDANSNLVSQSLTGTANQIIMTGAAGSGGTVLSTPQDIATISTPTFAGLTLTGLAPSLPVKLTAANSLTAAAIGLATTDVTGVLPIANGGTNSSSALNNNRHIQSVGGALVEAPALTNDGQLFIGSTGAAPVAASYVRESIKHSLRKAYRRRAPPRSTT